MASEGDQPGNYHSFVRDNAVPLAVLGGLGTILAAYMLVKNCDSNCYPVQLPPPYTAPVTHDAGIGNDTGKDEPNLAEQAKDVGSRDAGSQLEVGVKDASTTYNPDPVTSEPVVPVPPVIPVPVGPTPPDEPVVPEPADHCTYGNGGRTVSFTVAESPNADLRKLCGYTDAEATRIVAHTVLSDPNYQLRRGRGRQARYKFLQRNTGQRWKQIDVGDTIDLMIPDNLVRE